MSVEGASAKIVRDNFRQRWNGGNLQTLYKKWWGVARGNPIQYIASRADANPPPLPEWDSYNPIFYPEDLKMWAKNKSIKHLDEVTYLPKDKVLKIESSDTTDIAIIQIVRSMPAQDNWYKLKPKWNIDVRAWERSAKDAYLIGISAARKYIYLENQWVSDEHIWSAMLKAANENKHNMNFRIIIVLPYDGLEAARYGANQDGGTKLQNNIKRVQRVIGKRFGMYSPISPNTTAGKLKRPQIYVHSKIMIIDDVWTLIGSANSGGISLEGVRTGADKPDTELSAIVFNKTFARSLRQRLWNEHLATDKVDIKFKSADADKFLIEAEKIKIKRIRFCPIYLASVIHHDLPQKTLVEIKARSRIVIYGGVSYFLSLTKLPGFSLVVDFPAPLMNWGVSLYYRWSLRLVEIDRTGKVIELEGKNFKLVTINDPNVDTFKFGRHAMTVVGQRTADAIQFWMEKESKSSQWAQLHCRVQLVPVGKEPADDERVYDSFRVSRGLLLIEKSFYRKIQKLNPI